MPPELSGELPSARWRGSGVLRFLGLPIYDAQLWSTQAISGDGAGQALALVLVYARQLLGAQIASRSLQEMNRIGRVDDEQSARWLKAMTQLFPDLRAGDRLTGVQRPGVGTRFFLNGPFRGELADAEFTRLLSASGCRRAPLSRACANNCWAVAHESTTGRSRVDSPPSGGGGGPLPPPGGALKQMWFCHFA